MTVKPSPTGQARATKGWRTRLPVLAVVVAVVAGVVAAVSGAANPVNAMQFLPPGHWVYNSVLGSVVHIDGATSSIDAQGGVGREYGDDVQVVQGDTSGYVVGDFRVTEFGKSDLAVIDETTPAADEFPVSLEVPGGPYLVYRKAGKVVRLGEEVETLSVDGSLGDPVATKDGTLWLPRVGAPLLCRLPHDGDRIDCPVLVPEGDRGVLSVVNDRPVFVDTTSDMVHPVADNGLGEGRELGVDVPDEARVASSDVAGRLAILDPGDSMMHLVDTAGLDPDREAAPAIPVELADGGDFDGPVSTGDVVAVLDRKTDTLTTYDRYGKEQAAGKLPKASDESGDPRISRGQDDRIYVDGPDGEHVLVVDRDGKVTGVEVNGTEGGRTPAAPDPDGQAAPAGPPARDQQGSRDPRSQPSDPPANDPPANDPPANDPPANDAPESDPRSQDNRGPVQAAPPREPPPPPPPLPASPPGAPPAVSAQAGNASATVTWGAAQDNRAAIIRYNVSWTGSGGQQGSLTTGPGARRAPVNGLANGVSYVFTVSATNSAGTGPGASAAPVTPAVPVTAAGPPANLQVSFDSSTRSATLSWGQPALNGGTLRHYVVGVTGMPNRNVTATSATVTDIPGPAGSLTFTVQAVTARPNGGGLLTGATARRTVPDPRPSVSLSEGAPTDEYCGESDGCAWMHVVLSGFPPNTEVNLRPHSVQKPDYTNSHDSIVGEDGNHVVDEIFAYAGVGETVYVTATLPDGTVYESNRIEWGAG